HTSLYLALTAVSVPLSGALPLCLLLFSPQRPAYHRHLHSFPTRRSSDLTLSPAGSRRAAWLSAISRQRSSSTRTSRRQRSRTSRSKSTRLNSSHVSISYAVFCLKKKKKKTNMTCNLKHTLKKSLSLGHPV